MPTSKKYNHSSDYINLEVHYTILSQITLRSSAITNYYMVIQWIMKESVEEEQQKKTLKTEADGETGELESIFQVCFSLINTHKNYMGSCENTGSDSLGLGMEATSCTFYQALR